MSAHTPGPWSLSATPLRNYEATITRANAPGVVVADIPNPDNSIAGDSIALANARLIAAAPDLLEALRAADIIMAVTVGNAEYSGSVIQVAIDAALTKAGAR